MSDEDRAVCEAMIEYGGGFVRQLAKAALLADAKNLAIIKESFAEYWDRYAAAIKGKP